MDDDRFEWDNNKAAANWQKHRVTFHQATKAFNDPIAFEEIDEREDYGEERINLIGMCDGIILHLRSPRLKRAGVPVQLPLNRFHLQDHRFPDEAVPGRLPQVEHSGSCGTLPVTSRASPSTGYFCLNGDKSL